MFINLNLVDVNYNHASNNVNVASNKFIRVIINFNHACINFYIVVYKFNDELSIKLYTPGQILFSQRR